MAGVTMRCMDFVSGIFTDGFARERERLARHAPSLIDLQLTTWALVLPVVPVPEQGWNPAAFGRLFQYHRFQSAYAHFGDP